MGVSASGCHTNISLWRGGEEGVNKLHNDNFQAWKGLHLPDRRRKHLHAGHDDPQLPGKVGLQCVGGIVKHLGALTAIGCSP
ncbi:MAG: hypothetical protein CM15mP66_02020 [Pseudomonadota bacterium]|nr:MAG: hypothetical protein CM15mP66_02020 [Pseudomonadota bacterium]